jgi:hypothetical protein
MGPECSFAGTSRPQPDSRTGSTSPRNSNRRCWPESRCTTSCTTGPAWWPGKRPSIRSRRAASSRPVPGSHRVPGPHRRRRGSVNGSGRRVGGRVGATRTRSAGRQDKQPRHGARFHPRQLRATVWQMERPSMLMIQCTTRVLSLAILFGIAGCSSSSSSSGSSDSGPSPDSATRRVPRVDEGDAAPSALRRSLGLPAPPRLRMALKRGTGPSLQARRSPSRTSREGDRSTPSSSKPGTTTSRSARPKIAAQAPSRT